MTEPAQNVVPSADGDNEHDNQQKPDDPNMASPGGLAAISERLAELYELVRSRIAEADRQQAWVSQLTTELAEYRSDFIFKNVTGRIFRDLIQLHDTVGQTLEPDLLDRMSKEDLVSRLRHLHKGLLRTLDRQGLELISSDGGTPFNEAEQEAIDTRPATRPEDDGIVLESARCGFRYGSRLLRPESVIVGRYETQSLRNTGGELG